MISTDYEALFFESVKCPTYRKRAIRKSGSRKFEAEVFAVPHIVPAASKQLASAISPGQWVLVLLLNSYFMRIAGNIQTEMFEQLVELPYYEILHSEYADASKDYPYVSGVEPATDEEKKRVGLKLH